MYSDKQACSKAKMTKGSQQIGKMKLFAIARSTDLINRGNPNYKWRPRYKINTVFRIGETPKHILKCHIKSEI